MSFSFHLLGIKSYSLSLSLSQIFLLNRKQLFILKLFCACTTYNWSEKQTFRLGCNNFTGNCFINFHLSLAESRRLESSEPFMKSNLWSSHSFHACPCTGFHLDYCSILQRGIHMQISKSFSLVWGVCSFPYEHLWFHLCDAEVWQWQLADNVILLLADDSQNYWLSCLEHEWRI